MCCAGSDIAACLCFEQIFYLYSQQPGGAYFDYFYDALFKCQISRICDFGINCVFGSFDNGFSWGSIDNCGYMGQPNACNYSDIRLKQGIETLKNALSLLMNLEVVEYDWNDKLNEVDYVYFARKKKLHTIGLIAQNVKQYFPEVVKLNHEGYYWVDYTKLNAVLVEAIKEQQVFIEDIDKELEFIESKLN
jgi:hypothetical protein